MVGQGRVRTAGPVRGHRGRERRSAGGHSRARARELRDEGRHRVQAEMKSLGVAVLVRVVTAASGAIAAAPLAAQSARPCPSATTEPYLMCQVDRSPRADSANVAPKYPAMMLEAGITGTVRVAF